MPGVSSPFQFKDVPDSPGDPSDGSTFLFSKAGEVHSKKPNGVEIPLGRFSIIPPSSLRRWREMYSRRFSEKAVIATIGDSVTEGYGANYHDKPWPERLADMLNSHDSPMPGGWFPPSTKASIPGWPWSFSGTGAAEEASTGFGIGRRTLRIKQNRTATTTFYGTSFDLMFAQNVYQGTPTIAIDGTNYTGPNLTAGSGLGGLIWSSPALARGWHTVGITPQVEAFLEGIKVYDGNETSGVHVYNGGIFGSTSQDWGLNSVGQPLSDGAWPASYAAVDPSLIIISILHNDFALQVDPAQTYLQHTRILDKLLQLCDPDPSFLLWVPPERSDTPATLTYPWDEYAATYRDLAKAYQGTADIEAVDFRDLATHRKVGENSSQNFYTDSVHPNNSGYQWVADSFLEVLRATPQRFESRPQVSRLTSAATSTSTTYSSTGLEVQVEAGKTYRFSARGQYQTTATTNGLGLRMGGTCTATGVRYELSIFGSSATTIAFRTASALNADVSPATSVATANADFGWTIEGLIRVNAGGTLSVDFKSEVAGTVLVQPDSVLVLQEVA